MTKRVMTASTPPRCNRPHDHRPHTWVSDPLSDDEHRCPGLYDAQRLADLLATRPQIVGVGVGVASRIYELEVMNA